MLREVVFHGGKDKPIPKIDRDILKALDEEFQAFADSDTDPDILTFRSSTGRW
jgi:hypothetical protein